MEYRCHVPFKATNFKQVDTHIKENENELSQSFIRNPLTRQFRHYDIAKLDSSFYLSLYFPFTFCPVCQQSAFQFCNG